MRIGYRFSVGLALICGVSAGCDENRESQRALSHSIEATSAEFADHYERVGLLVPEQSTSDPIVRVSGIDVWDNGSFLISDVSESNVKLFDSNGSLVAKLGRRGEGPGEFMSPRFPRFKGGDEIVVADAQLSRIQSFTTAGEYLATVNLPQFARLMGFEVLSDGRFLVIAAGSSDEILFTVDSQGNTIGEYLPIARVRPDGQPEHSAWGSLRSFSVKVRGDTAFVTSSLADSLWQVDLTTDRVDRTTIRFPGFVPPHLPAEPPATAPALFQWANTVHLSSTLSVGTNQVFIPFVQGVLNYGDPMILVSRSRDDRWWAFANAPPIIHAHGDSLIAIHAPDADSLVLAVYRAKQ